MRYCILTTGRVDNPGYFRARELGSEFARRGLAVSFLADDLPQNHLPASCPAHAEVVYVPVGSVWEGIRARRRLLRRMRPDIVHVCGPYPKVFLALAGVRGFRVVGEWDEPPFVASMSWPKMRGMLLLDRWLRRRADLIVVATRHLHEIFAQRHGIQAAYIPHGTYLPEYPADPPNPFPGPTVVYLGNLHPVWDHDIIFEAARLLAAEGLRPPIQVVGGGPDLPRWRQFVAEHGLSNVELAGSRFGPDLWARLRHAHVSLFPMRDNLKNRCRCSSKMFAYAQARRPLIASRVGEIPEVLGEGPTYVAATPRAFADAIRQAVAAPRLPDVDYHVERHSYKERGAVYVRALAAAMPELPWDTVSR